MRETRGRAARRCLRWLALLAVATATPVDYAADHVVFAHLRRPAKIYRVFVASPGLFLWWLMKRQYLALASSSPRATGRSKAR
jgi:hypothetical protein